MIVKVIIKREDFIRFSMSKGTKHWLAGIWAALIDGIYTTVTVEVVDQVVNSTHPVEMKRNMIVLLSRIGLSVLSYLKNNPVPKEEN